jgi:hypothetical protein
MMEAVEDAENSLEAEAADRGEVTLDVWLTTRWPVVEVEELGKEGSPSGDGLELAK